MSLRRGGMWLAVVVLAALVEVPARDALAQDFSEIPDSLLDFRYKFTPIFEMNSTGNVTYNELGAGFKNTIVGVNGFTLNTSIGVSEKKYRLQDRSEKEKQFNNTLGKLVFPGLRVGVAQVDSRRISRAALVTGGFQDFILNGQSVAGSVDYVSPSGSAVGWDAHGQVTLQQNEFAFKSDEGQGGSVNGGVRYLLMDGRVRVGVRGAYSDLSEQSTSSVGETFDGLGTTSDSMVAFVDVRAADSLDVGFEWTDYDYEREFADQLRGSSGTQQVGAENLFREIERRDYQRYGVSMTSTPWKNLTIKSNARHTEQVNDFVFTPTRFSRTVTDELRGELNYKMKSGLSAALRLENSNTLRDLGPQSVSSYEDKRRRASLALAKSFSETFSMDVTLAQGIGQQFYVDYDRNPRDRDQLESSIKARISSRPFRKISTSMFLSVTSTDIVSIHPSNSGDNRTRERYDFKPDITYTFSDRLKVEQGYGLAIEFTDYDFVIPNQDDFIDRNVTFWNRITHNVTRKVTTIFYYSLTLHDRGAFLPEDPADINNPNADRFLDVDREDRTDLTRITLRYTVTPGLAVVLDHDYSRRRDTTIGSSNDRITTNGGVEGGVIGTYNWGPRGSLNFTLKRAERFSPFITADQESFWIANLALKYAL